MNIFRNSSPRARASPWALHSRGVRRLALTAAAVSLAADPARAVGVSNMPGPDALGEDIPVILAEVTSHDGPGQAG
mgnify:CR=1 FL=1